MKEFVLVAHAEQIEQAKKRDLENEGSEEWQVYNHGVFVAGKIKDALSDLADMPCSESALRQFRTQILQFIQR